LSDDPDSILFLLFIVVVLILLNGFFVAAEFALVKVRTTRIDQLIQEGNKRAKYVKKVLDDLETHLAAAQIGITLASLGLGWAGEPAVAKLLIHVFEDIIQPESFYLFNFVQGETIIHTVSFIVGFTIITYFHLTIGEQVPKIFSIEKAEKVSLWTALPLSWFCKIAFPGIRIIKGSTDRMLRVMGLRLTNSQDETHSEEEIKMIVSSSLDLDPDEQKMFNKVFEFNDRFVREVMVHRKDMDCVYLTDPLEETLDFIKKSRHSRFPVCREDRDDIIGYINLKDLYIQSDEVNIEKIIREIPRIYETMPIKKALKRLQKEKHQIAIIADEYGGVSGLVTIEDIVEVIVGDIQDEFDEEMESFQETEHGVIVDASLLVSDVTEELKIDLEEIDGIDTIGGYILSMIENRQPEKGMVVEIEQYHVKILEIEGLRILSLQFTEKNA